ncbi:MAG: TPM domain-containing protein [Chitinophagaceae bacterium]|nr:TPM domain-containing protein [Chitinophagaceae bacterium]
MRICILIFLLCFNIILSAQVKKSIPPKPPASAGLVHDFTKQKLLTPEQEAFLEKKLQEYDDSTSNQIAIVIVEDLKGYDANQFATAIGEEWGVGGSKEWDNGIVILVSTGGGEGNRDAYIAVGRGLEGAIPDMTAAKIVDDYLIPYLKTGEYFRAFNETTNAIILAAAGEYKAPPEYKIRKEGLTFSEVVLLFFLLVVLVLLFSGNNSGGYVSRRGYKGWYGPTRWIGGGGWSGGGGFGGGGFGGFGGGSFGGGGAGGKW